VSIRTMSAFGATAGAISLALLLSACGGQTATETDGLSGSVTADGSSTVAPLTEAAAGLFAEVEPGVNVTVATSGTGGGFEKFCAGETDISDASRPIKDEESATCAANGIEYTQVIVANDGLSVIINPENDWATDLTLEQLALIWSPESEGVVMNWSDVDPSWPNEKIDLFGAGTDSGTFDYFTDVVNGEEGASRTDYSPTEDDNVTVQGVSGSEFAIGYLGLSYAEENADLVTIASIDGVLPSAETVIDGSYSPLGRPLFIYVNNANYAEKPELRAFIDFYVANDADIAALALFIPLSEEQRVTAQEELASLVG
jgi:phosphate binding protein